MARTSVDLKVGGQLYRVKASAEPEALERYAGQVHERLRRVTGSDSPSHPQAMLLAAMALAHDLEEERGRRAAERARAEEMLRAMLARVNDALDSVDENGEPLEPPSSSVPV